MSPDALTSCGTASITADCTVDAVIAKLPAATAILNAHNIDTCCGGRASLGDAAALAHVDPVALIGLLEAAARDVTPTSPGAPLRVKSCSCGCH